MPFTHQNVKTTWTTIDMDGEKMASVLVIETDLVLDFEDPAYDQAKVDDLTNAAANYATETAPHIDRIQIVPIR